MRHSPLLGLGFRECFEKGADQPRIFDTALSRASMASFQAWSMPSLATEKDFFTTLPGSGLQEASTCSSTYFLSSLVTMVLRRRTPRYPEVLRAVSFSASSRRV